MAEFQYLYDVAVPQTITVVKDNSIPLKLIPGPKELAGSITIKAGPPSIAEVKNIKLHKQANFTVFHLHAKAVGKAELTATAAASPKGNPAAAPSINVIIEEPLVFPPAGTDEGLLVRLLLAETPSPDDKKVYKADESRTAMMYMRMVLANRLKTPSHIWSSKGAKTLSDVVKSTSPGEQFKGFSGYPNIANKIQKRLDQTLHVANDGSDPRRLATKKYIETAMEVANTKALSDPSGTGLYWWRTAGSGSPTPEAAIFKTLQNNTFYTLAPAKP